MKYKALALDLDGTLTDSKKSVSDVNKKAVSDAIDKGVKVILASGRPTFGVMPVAYELELDKKGGYVLSYNGGNIIDCKTGQLIYGNVLPEVCIPDICRLSRENGVYALTYYNDVVIAESDTDEYVIREATCNSAQIKKIDDLEKFVNYPVAKILVAGEHSRLVPIQQKMLEKYGDIINVFFSEDYFLEFVPAGVAKDESLKELLKILDIEEKKLIACGDGMNDIPMLKIAGLPVAMSNAYDAVKEYADVIAPSNDENGVAYIIDKYILN